jgi:hypothetical protein
VTLRSFLFVYSANFIDLDPSFRGVPLPFSAETNLEAALNADYPQRTKSKKSETKPLPEKASSGNKTTQKRKLEEVTTVDVNGDTAEAAADENEDEEKDLENDEPSKKSKKRRARGQGGKKKGNA